MNARSFIALTVLAAAPAFAQLAAPNAAGVAIGHIHINATDMDAQQRFWTQIGGKIVTREKIVMAQFPGIYILLRKQDNTGGTVGSVMNHFGFYVKDFQGSVAKWKAAGLKWEAVNNPNVGQGFLTGPDNVRIEIYENKDIPTADGDAPHSSVRAGSKGGATMVRRAFRRNAGQTRDVRYR